jgi:hypothetical protein
MKLQKTILSQLNRRKVKYLAVNAIGFAGVAIAVSAILFSPDQAALLSQMSHELSQSPLGIVVSTIKACF